MLRSAAFWFTLTPPIWSSGQRVGGKDCAPPSLLRPPGQSCWEHPSAPNLFVRSSLNVERPRPARQSLRWNTCHPRPPGPSFATVSMSALIICRRSRNSPRQGFPKAHGFDCRPLHALLRAGGLPPEPGAFLEYLRTCCPFPILRFRALVSIISAKHNARMALRWVRLSLIHI